MSRPKGCSFLIEEADPATIFTPEDFSEEHLMIRDLAARFVAEEVVPCQERIEKQEWDVTVRLLRRCGELGLLGLEVPEAYGGSNLDKVSAMIVSQQMASVSSFGVSFGGQAGIGSLPIVYFGSEELKARYLPGIITGERITAYALSEAGSGSDALAAKATSRLDGGHWVLNGEKMWITNAAFADLFITFAKVDGKEFSCFIVEKEFPGVSTGAEESKMGLKGSSTRPLLLENVIVPRENLLGEVGKGHRVAFSTLNLGRAKLASGAIGSAQTAFAEAFKYARQRMAFGKPIASFGAIQHKLAEMATRIWVTESMVYRTAHHLTGNDPDYAAECSILKVFGSEMLNYVVDEAVQIFGGYGFTSEYPVERYFRDARVHRIFEGTNEINRLLIGGLLFKRRVFASPASPNGELGGVRQAVQFVSQLAGETYGDTVRDQQEVLMHLADMMIDLYAMESALCRAHKQSSELQSSMAAVFVNDALARVAWNAAQAVAAMAEGQTLRPHLKTLRGMLDPEPGNTVRLRRQIAEYWIDIAAQG